MPHIPSLGYSFCQDIRLEPFAFYPDKPIEAQITVNHLDTSDKSYVHDASVSWIEDVNSDKFTACVMTAGFNERMSYSNVTVDWLAGLPRRSRGWGSGSATHFTVVDWDNLRDCQFSFGLLCLILYSVVGFMICILVRIEEVQTESKRTD